jgi:hypothetical protein
LAAVHPAAAADAARQAQEEPADADVEKLAGRAQADQELDAPLPRARQHVRPVLQDVAAVLYKPAAAPSAGRSCAAQGSLGLPLLAALPDAARQLALAAKQMPRLSVKQVQLA